MSGIPAAAVRFDAAVGPVLEHQAVLAHRLVEEVGGRVQGLLGLLLGFHKAVEGAIRVDGELLDEIVCRDLADDEEEAASRPRPK